MFVAIHLDDWGGVERSEASIRSAARMPAVSAGDAPNVCAEFHLVFVCFHARNLHSLARTSTVFCKIVKLFSGGLARFMTCAQTLAFSSKRRFDCAETSMGMRVQTRFALHFSDANRKNR
jgi:hypothetical protein